MKAREVCMENMGIEVIKRWDQVGAGVGSMLLVVVSA